MTLKSRGIKGIKDCNSEQLTCASCYCRHLIMDNYGSTDPAETFDQLANKNKEVDLKY